MSANHESTTKPKTYLDLLGQRNNILFVKIMHGLNVDLPIPFARFTVRSDIPSVQFRLFDETLQQRAFDGRFRDECVERRTVRVQDVRDESGGVVAEFRFADKLACECAWRVVGSRGWP